MPAALKIALPTTLLFVAFAFAGCHESSQAPEYTYTATDYSFSGPSELPPGLVTLHLVNDGAEHHHMQLLAIAAGHTYDDARGHFQTAGEGPLPDWLTMMGGPNAPEPGESTRAVVDLDPGNHILLCLVPDREGTPHFAHGMTKEITVTGEATPGEPPEDTVDVELVDYGFEAPEEFEAGGQTMMIHNGGAERHELAMAKLDEGATVMDLLAAFGPNSTGPPPGDFMGGITGIEPGATAWFPTDLEPGDYVFLCFFPTADGELHVMKGMMHEFTVA